MQYLDTVALMEIAISITFSLNALALESNLLNSEAVYKCIIDCFADACNCSDNNDTNLSGL